MMLAIVRYVRCLDSSLLALIIKTKLCQLVSVMMKQRDDLSFRQEMKFRNKLVEYLTDWAMGHSHQVRSIAHMKYIHLLDYLTVSVAFCGKAMLPAWKSNFRLLSTL